MACRKVGTRSQSGDEYDVENSADIQSSDAEAADDADVETEVDEEKANPATRVPVGGVSQSAVQTVTQKASRHSRNEARQAVDAKYGATLAQHREFDERKARADRSERAAPKASSDSKTSRPSKKVSKTSSAPAASSKSKGSTKAVAVPDLKLSVEGDRYQRR